MYKISKKLLIILALLISVTLVLASCGKTEEPAKPEPGGVTNPSDDDKPDDEKEPAEEPADDGAQKTSLRRKTGILHRHCMVTYGPGPVLVESLPNGSLTGCLKLFLT